MKGQAGLADSMFFLTLCLVASGIVVTAAAGYGVSQMNALRESYIYFYLQNTTKSLFQANCMPDTIESCKYDNFTIAYYTKMDLEDGVLNNKNTDSDVQGKDILAESVKYYMQKWEELGYDWCVVVSAGESVTTTTTVCNKEGITKEDEIKKLSSRFYVFSFPMNSYYRDLRSGELKRRQTTISIYLWS